MPRGYPNKLAKQMRATAEATDMSRMASEMGRRGAKARNKKLTPARRKEIAQNAANTRWQRERNKPEMVTS